MQPVPPIRRSVVLVAIGLGGIAAVVLLAVGCSSPAEFDRSGAIESVVRDGGGRLTRGQAECYVDRVLADLGPGALNRGTPPPFEQVPKLTRIRVDCIGIAGLGTEPPPLTLPPTIDPVLGSQPSRFGDDSALDVLYDACAATGSSACDELFNTAPLGTDYEEFASTCGGRTKEILCAERYPDGSTTTTVPKRR